MVLILPQIIEAFSQSDPRSKKPSAYTTDPLWFKTPDNSSNPSHHSVIKRHIAICIIRFHNDHVNALSQHVETRPCYTCKVSVLPSSHEFHMQVWSNG
jgi:hypothetical protein